MFVLRLSVVPRERAIGLLTTKGNPPPDCSGQGEGRSFLASSRASRAGAAAPSFQSACVRAYIQFVCVCIYVYVCMCADMYIYIYMCMCVCMMCKMFINNRTS